MKHDLRNRIDFCHVRELVKSAAFLYSTIDDIESQISEAKSGQEVQELERQKAKYIESLTKVIEKI